MVWWCDGLDVMVWWCGCDGVVVWMRWCGGVECDNGVVLEW